MGSYRTRVIAMASALLSAGALAVSAPARAGAAGAPGGSRTVAVAAVRAAAGKCKPVWFIGARGSGEHAKAREHGMGKEVYYMASKVSSALKREGVKVAYMPVDYPADSVNELYPDKAVLALIGQGHIAAALAVYKKTSVDKYDASIGQGIKQAEADVAAVVSSCPGAEIILGGYSQGAAVVHDAENWLVHHKPAEFRHIKGTLLLGDPDRVPHTKARRFGTSPAGAKGVRVWLHLVRKHDVPAPAHTANIANAGDFVGDFRGITTFVHRRHDARVHTTYAKTSSGRKLLASAATWVATHIRPVITTRKLPAATVGKHYKTQLTTADHRKGRWKITRGKLPAGLSLSGHAISGTPRSHGTRSFTLKFTDIYSRTATATARLTVRPSPPASGTWTTVKVPLPADAGTGDSEVIDMSCPTATFCLALGSYTDTAGQYRNMQLTWNGTSWSAARSLGETYIRNVSCGSPSFCVSVGDRVWTWTGGSWTSETYPLPPNAAGPSQGSGMLDNVSCPSPSFCVATGTYPDTSGNLDGMILTLSDGSWTAEQAPLPANAASGSGMAGISCPSTSYCVAAGSYTDTSGNADPMILTLSGGSWTAEQVPLPANAASGPDAVTLAGVSCVSASFCDAVGVYNTTAVDSEHNLLLTWRGQSWTASGHSAGSGWGAVSCASASFCAAVDGWPGPAVLKEMTWTGGSWAATPFPSKPYPLWDIYRLTCLSASFCVAAGDGAYWNSSHSRAVLVTRAG